MQCSNRACNNGVGPGNQKFISGVSVCSACHSKYSELKNKSYATKEDLEEFNKFRAGMNLKGCHNKRKA